MVMEFCYKHGHAEFFLAVEFNADDGECLGEMLLCPYCHPDHPENPEVIEKFEKENVALCDGIMHL